MASAIRAGVGVALINRKSMPPGAIEWDRAPELPTPPRVSHVARTAPGEASPLTVELAAEIRHELTEPNQPYGYG